MDEEADFLRAWLERPDDAALLLVYADWLDEHAQAAKAQFLRVTVELSRASADQRRTAEARELRRRWRALSRPLPANWFCAFDGGARVRNCDAARCPKYWASLRPAADLLLRSCPDCGCEVRYVDSDHERRRRANMMTLVALDSRVRVRSYSDEEIDAILNWREPRPAEAPSVEQAPAEPGGLLGRVWGWLRGRRDGEG